MVDAGRHRRTCHDREMCVRSILDKILRMGEGKILKTLKALTDQVNALEDSVSDLSDAELRAETDRFKEQVADGESLDALLPEAFAVVREAAEIGRASCREGVRLGGRAEGHRRKLT